MRYQSTHNERDRETGYDFRNARSSAADVVRFGCVDPMEGKYPAWSGYCYVSGNPVARVDPEGTTDYYSLSGDKIGTDGEDNGERKLSLTRASDKAIKKAMKKNGKYTSGNDNMALIPVPTNEEVNAMDDVYADTEQGKPHEEGFAAAVDDNGKITIVRMAPGGDVTQTRRASIDPEAAIKDILSQGGVLLYLLHSHPYYKQETNNGVAEGGRPYPSGKIESSDDKAGDHGWQRFIEREYKAGTSIILGYSSDGGDNIMGFYNSKGVVTTEYFNTFKNAVTIINQTR